MRSAVAVMIMLAACKGEADQGKQAAKSPQDAAAAPTDVETLALEVDGKPIKGARAFIKRKAPDRYQLYLSDQGGSCAELLDNVFNARDRIDVLADLTPRLAADGSQVVEVSYVHEGPTTMAIAPGSKATVGGAVEAGRKVELRLDLDATGDGKTIAAHGTVTAEGCGFDPDGDDGVPRAAHPSTATITIAGKQLAIKSAIIKGDEVAPVLGAPEVRDLVLSTGPKDCSGSTPWAEIIVERDGGAWKVRGTWLTSELANSGLPDEQTQALVATLGATGTSDDGPTIAVELGGTGTIDGYPVELAGTIEAIDCGK